MFHSDEFVSKKVGRNEKCPCGSGKKHKHCCLIRGCLRPPAREGSLLQVWANALEAFGGTDWAQNHLLRTSFENLVWFWFQQFGKMLVLTLRELIAWDSELKRVLHASKSPLLQVTEFPDADFWLTLFKDTPETLRERIGEKILRSLSQRYPATISNVFTHLWVVCCRGEFVLVRARTLSRSEVSGAEVKNPSESLSYQELMQIVSSSVPIGWPSDCTPEMSEILQIYQQNQNLLGNHDSAPHFLCSVQGPEDVPVEFALPPCGRIKTGNVAGKSVVLTHKDRITFLASICGLPVALTRDDAMDPQESVMPLLQSFLQTTESTGIKMVPMAYVATPIVRLFAFDKTKHSLLAGFLFQSCSENWISAEERVLHSIWDEDKRATAKAVTFGVVGALRQEWSSWPSECRSMLRPLFEPQSAEELAHVSQLIEAFFASTVGLRNIKMKAAHICECVHPEFHRAMKKLADKKSSEKARPWRLRRSGVTTGSSQQLDLANQLRLLRRIQDFMVSHQRRHGLELYFRCQLDSAPDAQQFQVDVSNSIFFVASRALTEPWHKLENAGLWALGHFLAQHYLQQGKSGDESWSLAWKRLNMKPDLQMTKTTMNQPPVDWFEESGSLTSEQKRFLDKVNKLLALGQSDNEHEATLAMERAQEFMRSNKLSAARMINGQMSEGGSLWEMFDIMHIYLGSSLLPTPIRHIGSLLEKHYDVNVIYGRFPSLDSSKDERVLSLIGRREALLMAEHVFDFLLDRMDKLWEVARKEKTIAGRHKMSYQIGLLKGFDLKLTQQAEMRRKPSVDASATEGSLIRLQDMKRDEFMHLLYPNLGTLGANRTQINSEAYSSGHSAGRELNVNQPISSSRAHRQCGTEALPPGR